MIALSLSVPWLPRRALPYIAFVALIADLLSRACDGWVADEQSIIATQIILVGPTVFVMRVAK